MDRWLAERSLKFDSSGIRKVFDLAAKIEDPINLSIGQPDFDVPQAVQDGLHRGRSRRQEWLLAHPRHAGPAGQAASPR